MKGRAVNFTSLAYFETLAHERNFTRAAHKLHITQQSLSSAIAKLESELGCQLFVRHVPLEITYAGKVLLRYARSFREEQAVMMHEFNDISQNQQGVLRVGATYTRGRVIMPDTIAAFQKRFPSIRINLIEDTNDALRRKLIEDDIDIAIANFPQNIPGLAVEEFYREEVVILVSRELLKSLYGDDVAERVKRFEEGEWSALADCPLILNSANDIGGHIERSVFKRAGIASPRIMATSTNAETLMALSLRGVGAFFCPETLARAALSSDELSTLYVLRLGDYARYPIAFGYQQRSYQWSVINAFIEVAREITATTEHGSAPSA